MSPVSHSKLHSRIRACMDELWGGMGKKKDVSACESKIFMLNCEFLIAVTA